MEKLIIRKAISKDQDRIIEIFESQDTKWDIPYAKQYYDDYFNDAIPGDMVFVGIVDDIIVAVSGYCPDADIDDVYWLNWHYTHKDYEGKGMELMIFLIIHLLKDELKNYFLTKKLKRDFLERIF